MPEAGPPRIYTVPPGRPFLDCLARAILAGDLPASGGPAPRQHDLPRYTLLLPTRRAARALQEAFLRESGADALLLPRIRPISEEQDDLSLLAGLAGLPSILPGDGDIPPAIGELERRLALTSLVLRWSEAMRAAPGPDGTAPFAASGIATPAQAIAMAAELARLMDMVETENVDLTRLKSIVPDTYTEHWQKTLQFLEIVLAWWPEYLQQSGRLSPADRRNRAILAEARRLAGAPATGPVIVAGVTGSVPATAELMRAVARMPSGAIVLPGLDTALDEASWQAIAPATSAAHPEHPQFGLARLLFALGVARADVPTLPGAEPAPGALRRQRLVAEALRPAATTDRWHSYIAAADPAETAAAVAGIGLIEAPTAQDEAEAVALILREAAETPGRTAALVSPDRLLARRVAIRLESWGIRVDDSAGRPLAKTVPGTFLDLVISAAGERYAPAALMALLKHPLARLGLPVAGVRRAARALELIAFRAPYLGRGIAGVAAALDRAGAGGESGQRPTRAARRLWEADWQAARDLVGRLGTAMAPLDALTRDGRRRPLAEHARAHVAAAEALAQLPADDVQAARGHPLWQGEAGEAAALLFAGLFDAAIPAPAVTAAEYPDFYRGLVASENVRARIPVHPRLSIWGPFEARLQQPDVLVLGSLNDGTWPEPAETGPWLSRPMRQALGMPQPEAAIGLAAHDFTQLMGAPSVYLTRAAKVDGVPTVPSRWLLRLRAVLDGLGATTRLTPREPWLGWARNRDQVSDGARGGRAKPPEPKPALALRPRRLSVSDVETWIANPYAIYAARILGLEPLPPLGAAPDAALRGAIIHEALSRFAKQHPTSALPPDAAALLLAHARAVLSGFSESPRIAAFWLPRLGRFAHWFGETEPGRRAGTETILAEVTGTRVLAAPGGPFTLTARADRIDTTADGLVITDYKTGAGLAELARRAVSGEAPQLALEAAIAIAGGFAGLAPARVQALRYISASGGEPPGDAVDLKTEDVAALARTAEDGLVRLVAAFDDPATPYRPMRRARFNYDYDAFAQLARVAEWSAQAREGEP